MLTAVVVPPAAVMRQEEPCATVSSDPNSRRDRPIQKRHGFLPQLEPGLTAEPRAATEAATEAAAIRRPQWSKWFSLRRILTPQN